MATIPTAIRLAYTLIFSDIQPAVVIRPDVRFEAHYGFKSDIALALKAHDVIAGIPDPSRPGPKPGSRPFEY